MMWAGGLAVRSARVVLYQYVAGVGRFCLIAICLGAISAPMVFGVAIVSFSISVMPYE